MCWFYFLRGPFCARATSAGWSAGNFAEFHSGPPGVFAELAATIWRGFNLAVLDVGGALSESESFDTYGDSGASGRLEALVQSLPAGTAVLIAVMDSAARNLYQDAKDALLQHFGADVSGLGDRYSYAAIAVKGELSPRVERMDTRYASAVIVDACFNSPCRALAVRFQQVLKDLSSRADTK